MGYMVDTYRALMRGTNTDRAQQAQRAIVDFLLHKLEDYRRENNVSDLEIQRRFGLGTAVICKMGPKYNNAPTLETVLKILFGLEITFNDIYPAIKSIFGYKSDIEKHGLFIDGYRRLTDDQKEIIAGTINALVTSFMAKNPLQHHDTQKAHQK